MRCLFLVLRNQIALTSLLAIALFALSDAIREHSGKILHSQRVFVRGIDYLPSDDESRTIPKDVKELIKNDYFTRGVVENSGVRAVKAAIGQAYSNVFFPDVWTLFWYVSFLGNEEDLRVAISTAIGAGALREENCVSFRSCESDSTTTVTFENVQPLLAEIRKDYVVPAIAGFEELNIDRAHILISTAVSLWRSIHFKSEEPFLAPDPYNEVLVASAFLSKYTSENVRQFVVNDIKVLIDSIAGKSEENAFQKVRDSDIRAYVLGLEKLRSNCFWEAADVFSDRASKAGHDPIREIFVFMALRSLARPFVDLKRLVLSSSAGEIDVSDCGERHETSKYVERFQQISSGMQPQYVKSVGLNSDLGQYARHVPTNAQRKAELCEILTRAAEEAKAAEARNAGKVADSTLTNSGKTVDVNSSHQNSGQETDERESRKAARNTELAPGAAVATGQSGEGLVPARSQGPTFRWPVRGRVIASFGPRPNGLQNDGINLAVPEGTPIKAAGDGIVAYAGDLKGYGNLVLVRHGNDFMTAYAHASEIMVKRGDFVERGQVIAKSGQTGNVTSPQLHFEIRKNTTPVDPSQYLNGA
jgi:murein DD-endopeptidase MepM/ murein hydrolase activator NlpD